MGRVKIMVGRKIGKLGESLGMPPELIYVHEKWSRLRLASDVH